MGLELQVEVGGDLQKAAIVPPRRERVYQRGKIGMAFQLFIPALHHLFQHPGA